MNRALFLLLFSAFLLPGQSVLGTLDEVEKRYNTAKTLIMDFEQTYSAQGAARRPEKGVVHLDKPGKMRWNYSDPEGKVFLTRDNEFLFYSPRSNRVERGSVKESADYRAPFAFLLGRIDFRREFDRFLSRKEGENLWITATPKSPKFPYEKVSFLVTPDHRIARLLLEGKDNSEMLFVFRNEQRNVGIPSSTFAFEAPKGAEIVETRGN